METIYIDPHTKESLERDDIEQIIGKERQEREYARRSIIHDRCQKMQNFVVALCLLSVFVIGTAWAAFTDYTNFLVPGLCMLIIGLSGWLTTRLTDRMIEVEGPIE